MSLSSDWHALRRHLDALRAEVAAEIRSYPAPIPACDAQFNHLTEQRRLLALELERLDAARERGTETVEAFLGASPYLDDQTKQQIRAALARAVLFG